MRPPIGYRLRIAPRGPSGIDGAVGATKGPSGVLIGPIGADAEEPAPAIGGVYILEPDLKAYVRIIIDNHRPLSEPTSALANKP